MKGVAGDFHNLVRWKVLAQPIPDAEPLGEVSEVVVEWERRRTRRGVGPFVAVPGRSRVADPYGDGVQPRLVIQRCDTRQPMPLGMARIA